MTYKAPAIRFLMIPASRGCSWEVVFFGKNTTFTLIQIYDLCHARVEPQTPPHGKRTRLDCSMIQIYDLRQQQISTRVMFTKENIMCSAYGDLVSHLANVPKDYAATKADLLKPQIFPQIQLLTGTPDSHFPSVLKLLILKLMYTPGRSLTCLALTPCFKKCGTKLSLPST